MAYSDGCAMVAEGYNESGLTDIPDLEACSAFGETPEEALRQVNVAKEAWIEAARAEGKAVPEPMYRPVIYQAAPSYAPV